MSNGLNRTCGEFLRPAAFDLALNVFTSFGYFDDQAENRRVLENIFASLKPGGAFVFDHLGKEFLAARFVPTLSQSLPDGTILVQRQSIMDDWSRIDGEWILLAEGRATTFRLRHWLYSGREIRELFTERRLHRRFALWNSRRARRTTRRHSG